MRLLEQMSAYERDGRPIRVAVIGAGQMGSGLVHQMARLPGFRLAAVCDLVIARAAAAAARADLAVEVAGSPEAARGLLAEGRTVIISQAVWAVDAPEVDVLVEATGDPETSAQLALAAIARQKPFVTMTVEADATVGPLLASMAREAGAVYTVGAGDEPSVLYEMVEFARAIGLEVVCAGKGKNNRLDRTATAERLAAEAAARGMSARMLASFVDGTKTMVEMAALANAAGLRPDCPGMHGPRADLRDLLRIFIPEDDGGILHRRGVVDYAIGDVAPGVFLVVTTPSEPIRRDLAYLRMGDGPYYLLSRPYHLASLEVPLSVARAVLRREPTMAAAGAPHAECVAVAKRNLRMGETIDGIGGAMVYGLIQAADRAADAHALPIGVAQGARLVRDVRQGMVLIDEDVMLDESLTIVRLRREQDDLAGRGTLSREGRRPACGRTGC